jgi:phage terminase Nu1 subunit (DNA packaging protein)
VASQLLTRKQLLAALPGTDAKRLAKWIKSGLPVRGKGAKERFDPEAVERWLIENDQAKPASAPAPTGRVCTTRAAAAAELGVDIRTLAEWLNDPTFPGKAGSPGRSDGHFPLDEIRTWRSAKFENAPGGNDELGRLRILQLQTKVEREQLELARELGRIVDVEDVRNLLEAGVATAKSILDQLPEQVLANLPGKLSKEIKNKIRELAQSKIEQAYTVLESLSREDEEEVEPEPKPAEPAPKRTKRKQ